MRIDDPAAARPEHRIFGISLRDITGDVLKIAGTTIGAVAIGGAVLPSIASLPALGLVDHLSRPSLMLGSSALGAILGGIAGVALSVHEIKSHRR